MAKRRHKVEQIIGKLREAEVAVVQGHPLAKVVRKLGITTQTYYRWRKEYGGLRTDQARRFKQLEKENVQLLTLERSIEHPESTRSPWIAIHGLGMRFIIHSSVNKEGGG